MPWRNNSWPQLRRISSDQQLRPQVRTPQVLGILLLIERAHAALGLQDFPGSPVHLPAHIKRQFCIHRHCILRLFIRPHRSRAGALVEFRPLFSAGTVFPNFSLQRCSPPAFPEVCLGLHRCRTASPLPVALLPQGRVGVSGMLFPASHRRRSSRSTSPTYVLQNVYLLEDSKTAGDAHPRITRQSQNKNGPDSSEPFSFNPTLLLVDLVVISIFEPPLPRCTFPASALCGTPAS